MRPRLLMLVCFAVCACGGEEPSAPLTPGGGNPQVIGGSDAGQNVDDVDGGGKPDGGTSDGPRAGECKRVEAVQIDSDATPRVTATEAPRDFLVTRTVGTWRDDCEVLVIELSDGVCPHGDGHELEIELAASAITDGRIGLGLNVVEPEPVAVPGIRVRYTRPDRFAPVGTFGTCDGASGTMSFLDPPDITRAMNLRAIYDFRLTPCDGKSAPAQVVAGYFDVRVVRSLSAACP